MKKIVLITGGFDPLHSGHIAYFEAARQLGDMLIVGLNSDDWLRRKKGRAFMDIYERDKVVSSLKMVDKVVHYPDADDANIEFVFGVGGENKANSSSWILQEWKAPKTERPWGYYRVLHEVPGMKVKELTLEPDGALSMQRHANRAEFWMISEGSCIVHSQMPNGYALPSKTLNKHDEYKVPQGEWHQLVNPFLEPCKIVEIQYGLQCTEEDIERK